MPKARIIEAETKEMDFLDHLEELRWRLIKALLSILGMGIITFTFSDRILEWLLLPTRNLPVPITLQVLKIQGLFMLKFSIAIWGGVILAIPFVVYQIWAFVAPALYQEERRWGSGLIIGVTLAFIVGVGFAYYVLIPYAIAFLAGVGIADIARNISIEFYIKFVLQLLLATGLIFQMPVASFLLSKMGILTPQFLTRHWRLAVVVIAIVAAIITPPDPVSMIIMAVPLLLLYAVSIIISAVAQPRQGRRGKREQSALAG
jgi:sec-independent protein translocase protein TatC